MSVSTKTGVKIKDVVGSLLEKDHLLLGVSTNNLLILVEFLISLLLLNLSPKITIIPCIIISWPILISREKEEF